MTNTVELPKVLEVTEGVVLIGNDYGFNSVIEYETYFREVTHLLSLLPDADKANAELEDDGLHITTSHAPSLRYACNKYFLCPVCTAVSAVIDKYGDEYDDDTLDEMIEQVSTNYDLQVLESGVYLVRN